ncbi:MAG: hypothetical protein LBC75_00850 [Fibromonadaceae bacterium]|jgi:hypothetical protein|nr:hypothetical protein [Fibromonadaceae bacterium]
MKIKRGIVGFVDILGYKNIIENNEIEKLGFIIQEIFNVVKNVNDIIYKEKEITNLIDRAKKRLDYTEKNYKWEIDTHVISDSIILLKEINEADDILYNHIKFIIYIRSLQKLCRISLEKGIAIRGAISYGDYIDESNIIASKALVYAYQLSEKLDFSGIAVCKEFVDFCKEMDKNNVKKEILKKLDENTSKIHCPFKDGSEQEIRIIDWISDLDEKEYNGDLRQYLFNSFSKHNKDISQSVIRKINNTENVLRSILAKKNPPT